MLTEGSGGAKSEDEIREALERQIKFLRKSCEAYDQGELEEAERIASATYVICHDGRGRTKSLLSQLKLKSRIIFFDTSSTSEDKIERPGQKVYRGPSYLELCAIKSLGEETPPIFIPKFQFQSDNPPLFERKTFRNWYESPVSWQGGIPYSRKNFVFALRSMDGGAHVDSDIRDQNYSYIKHIGSSWARWSKGEVIWDIPLKPGIKPEPLGPDEYRISGGHWATMRQIGWELDQSLANAGY